MLSLCFPLLLAAISTPTPTIAPQVPQFVIGQTAPEEEAPAAPTLQEVPGLVTDLVQAIRDKNWTLMVALIVMLLVLAVDTVLFKFGVLSDKARKMALPWIAAGTGCLVTFSSTLIAGGGWWAAILSGFVLGTAAGGLWSLVGKHVKKLIAKKTKKPPPAASEG